MLDLGTLPSSLVMTGLASSCSIQPPGRRLLGTLVSVVLLGKGWERRWLLVALFVDPGPLCFCERADHDAHVDEIEWFTPRPVLESVVHF